MKKMRACAWLSVLLLVAGCSTNEMDRNAGDGAEGTLFVRLAGNGAVEQVTGDDGEVLFDVPDVNDFSVLIEDAGGNPYAGFDKFSDMPRETRLKSGGYTLTAFYGKDRPAAFNAPFYKGSEPFTIEGGASTEVAVTAKIANVLLRVEYSDRFKEVFEDYSLDVMTEHTANAEGGYEALRFVGDDPRVGFFRPAETIWLSMNVTKKDNGETYRYGAEPITGSKGGEYYALTFDSDAKGQMTVEIKLDDETESREMAIDLDSGFLPKEEPAINATFVTSTPYTFRYGFFDGNPLVAVLKAPGKIRNVKLETDSPYALSHGVPAHVDFSAMTPEVEEALRKLGIEWDEGLLGGTNGTLRFTRMFASLDPSVAAEGSYHRFLVTLTDDYGRSTDKELQFDVLPLKLRMNGYNDYDIWAKEATLAKASVADLAPEEQAGVTLRYEISADGENWAPAGSETADGRLFFGGLAGNTLYRVRAELDGVYSVPIEFRTEEARNVPNASFEEFHAEKFNEEGLSQSVVYYPYAQGEPEPFWQTLNPMTTKDKLKEYYRSYPCVEVVDDATDGRYALKIQTVGWGAGSTATGTGVKQRTPGKLFIGDYLEEGEDWNLGNVHIAAGKPFGSRPKTISFDYRYYAYKKRLVIFNDKNTMQVKASLENRENGEVTVIATAEFERTLNHNTLSDYETQTMELDYLRKDLKATHLCLLFQSQPDAEKYDINDVTVTDTKEGGEKNQSKKVTGSYIILDNIVLGY